MKRFLEILSIRYHSLSSRERILLALLGGTLMLGLLVGLVVMWSGRESSESKPEDLQQAISDLNRRGDDYKNQHAYLQALHAHMSGGSLQLGTFVENTAAEQGLKISEQNADKDQTIGKKYTVRSVHIRLSKAPLSTIMKFMQNLQNAPVHVIQVTDFTLNSTDDRHVEFITSMTVSVYELTPVDKNQTPANSDRKPEAST